MTLPEILELHCCNDCPEQCLSDTGGGGIVINNSNSSDITIDNLTITDSVNAAISVTDSDGAIKIGLGGPAIIHANTRNSYFAIRRWHSR